MGDGTLRFAADAAFIAKYDADERYLWDRVFRANSLFADVVVGSRDELYVSGFFEEPGSDFGGGPLRPTGLIVAAPVGGLLPRYLRLAVQAALRGEPIPLPFQLAESDLN